MKFKVPSKTLYTYASNVSKVISSKNALSILNNFLISLEEGHLTITGSDVENALSAKFEVMDPSGEGKFCLDARRLVDLLKEFPDLPLTIEIDDTTLEVTISNVDGEYKMVALPADQFPKYDKDNTDEAPVELTIPAELLAKGIDNTLFAVGTDDFHPQMMGILLDIKEEGINFVATDTRKMVRYITTIVKPGLKMRCILPSKPANILKNILTPEGNVDITMTSKSATFVFGTYTFNCRFIKGNYPDYNRVIPSNNPYQMRVNRQKFLNAVRRAGVFVDPGYGMEKFRISNDHIQIKSSDPSLQQLGSEQLNCEYQGPELVMGFSAPYLVEICNTLKTEDILLNLADPGRPGVFTPTENEEGTDMLVLLMPMNVVDF